MPERPQPKLHAHPQCAHSQVAQRVNRIDPPRIGYAELHCLSNFSFLRGASHPEELIARAAELGYAALALTDLNSLAGVVRAHLAAKEHNLHLLVGAEITPVDAPPLVLLAPDRAAYGRLARLITRGRLRTPKGQCAPTFADVAHLAAGLNAIALPPADNPGADDFRRGLYAYQDLFGERLFLAAELACDEPDEVRLTRVVELARQIGVPLVATNAVHYHVPQRRYLQDVLTCIRAQCTLATAGRWLFANAERHLRPVDEIARRYALCPDAVRRTVEIAQGCTFSLDELRYEYPHELVPAGVTPMAHLERLTRQGAAERFGTCASEAGPAVSPFFESQPGTTTGVSAGWKNAVMAQLPPRVRELLERELDLIRELRYEHYFLTVWDLVRFARSRGILCQGRGSAANSAVCYCLGVTAVDPTRIDLLFERFISKERNEPPDIDIDFEHERREEVFQYIYEKYGRERAAITAEVITYRPRSAVRDVGKALGLSLDRVDVLAKALDWWSDEAVPEEALRAAGLDPGDRTVQMLIRLVRQLLGFPRHLSQHVGGFVITETPLCEIVPLENGAMPGRTFIEWDKDDIDALGILKVDCLALGMLTALRKCFEGLRDCEVANLERGFRNDKDVSRSECVAKGERADQGRISSYRDTAGNGVIRSDQPDAQRHRVRRQQMPPQSLLDIPPEDPAVYDMICAADTVGVFQIESRAQMSMLPRLRPRCFYDLVIEVAIVRPGPIQGGMVHPFLRRRDGFDAVDYPSEAIRGVLEKTLGVPLFQEQVMRVAVVAAGFTPGEADQLRRAMAAWRRSGQLETFQAKLVRGMLANGYTPEFAMQIYKQIRGFGEYGFPESHAASFALLVYASAWLKHYYPAAFCAALLNAQPLGFYTPGQLIRDASEHGVDILPIDVNASAWDCSLEDGERESGIRARGAKGQGRASRGVHASRSPIPQPALRLGMRLIKGLSREKVRGILAARREGPIRSLRRLARRPDVSRETLARLAAADAFRSLGLTRRQALWRLLALDDDEPPLLFELEPEEPEVALPEMPLEETVVQDYDAVGFSLSAHPIGLVRDELRQMRAMPNGRLRRLPNGRPVRVAGLVTVRQRPSTARGIVFMTLEDETGAANLVIHPPIWQRDQRSARGKIALLADGHIERQGAVVHVIVRRMQDLSARLAKLAHRSRDFR